MNDQNAAVAPPGPAVAPPPMPPPTTQRRPRVREVSSRFMSPLIQSNSTPNPNPTSDFPRSKSVQRRLKTDENHFPETNRKSDGSTTTPSIPSTVVKKQPQHRVKGGSEQKNHHNAEIKTSSFRPDTPTHTADRIVPSRYRQVSSVYRSNSLNSSVSSSISSMSSTCSEISDATRLLQEVTSDVESKLSRVLTSSRDDIDSCKNSSSVKSIALGKGSSSCPNSPLCAPNTKLRNGIDTRSSMPNVDKWLEERNGERIGGDCARSLNFSSAKLGGGFALPPHPSSCLRSGLDAKKGKKSDNNRQEDVHSLKMLTNHYMQWRFANARSKASMLAQKHEVERKFYALSRKISDMRDSVKRKQHELTALRKSNMCATIVESQLPYLDEWSTLEELYSTSLSETTNALVNSSIRLPLGGEVKADPVELKEALDSAVNAIELIGSHIQRYVMKAEEMDVSLSKLGRMASEEKALIEECGDVLSKTHVSQLQECSLQCALMQFQQRNFHQQKINEVIS